MTNYFYFLVLKNIFSINIDLNINGLTSLKIKIISIFS